MNQPALLFVACLAFIPAAWSQAFTSSVSPPLTASPFFTMTGRVLIDDGSPLPDRATIRTICNGSPRTVSHSDTAGEFAFQWTLQSAPAKGQAVSCELRAELAGYASGIVTIAALDGHDAGVIWLHKLGTRGQNLVSISTLRAPADALRDFNKGTELSLAGKFTEAAASFQRAVDRYPGFAEAWMDLGKMQYRAHSTEAAATSLKMAASLDPRMSGTWQVLGYIAFDRRDWAAAVDYLNQAEHLEPQNSLLPWFFSAVAYYQLGNFDDAERCIRSEIKLDPQFHYRRAQYVLGLILLARQDFQAGTEALRAYLASSPNPADVDPAKTLLSRLQPIASK